MAEARAALQRLRVRRQHLLSREDEAFFVAFSDRVILNAGTSKP